MKSIKILWVLLTPALFLLFSCKPATTETDTTAEMNMDSIRMKVTDLENAFADASNRGDAEGVASYYSNDAISYAPGEEPLKGKDAIKARIQRDMDSDTTGTTLTLEPIDVFAGGNYVTEVGKWTDKDKDGKTVDSGTYMTLFEMRDGKWVAIRDIWNSSSKPMMAEPTASN